MKVIPPPGMLPRPSTAMPQSFGAAEPGASFASLLGRTPADGNSGVARSYGFSALGMFGLSGAASDNPGSESVGTLPVSDAAETATAASHAAADSAPSLQHGEVPSTGQLRGQAASPVQELARIQVPLVDGGEAIAAETQAESSCSGSIEPEGSAPAEGSGPPAPARSRPPMRPAPVNLLVSGSDDALQIVLRSPDDTPEARFRQRRLVEKIAAEFGVTLASVHLNGSDTEPSFASRIGGAHGDRAR